MILVTGSTGFIGNALIRHLSGTGQKVKLLLHPSQKSPFLPKSLPIEVAVSSLSEERNLRTVLGDVDVIFHLTGSETHGTRSSLYDVEVKGTNNLCSVAKASNVKQIIYLSHIGADKASAYPLLKAKGLSEDAIINSGLDYLIIRTGLVYGVKDHFTTQIARLANKAPGILLIPDDGSALLQPVWIEDIVTCLTWSINNPELFHKTIEIGGPEFFSFKDIIRMVLSKMELKRSLVSIKPVILSRITEFLELIDKDFPTSVFWIDYLASDRICDLNSIPIHFGFKPARFLDHIDYLKDYKEFNKGKQ